MHRRGNLWRRDTASRVVVLACAAAAGAHAGLIPAHLREEPRLGIAFIVAVVLLLGAGAALLVRPTDRAVAGAVAVLFVGLIAAYISSRTAGIPLLSPDAESLDPVGIGTNVVEAIGFAVSLSLAHRSESLSQTQEVPH